MHYFQTIKVYIMFISMFHNILSMQESLFDALASQPDAPRKKTRRTGFL